jgi:hypothetical protein
MYFKNRKTSSDFKQLLGKQDNSHLTYPVGFSSGNALYRLSDIWIDEFTFVNALKSVLGQKLWSHDHLKILKKVNLHKESEDKLVEINEELDQFYSCFAAGLKNLFGYVSEKRMQDYLRNL